MKSIGGRLDKWEKAKQGNPQNWIKNKMEKDTSFTLVGTGQLVINIYSTQRWDSGNKITMRGSVILCSGACGCAFKGSRK